MEVTGIYLGVSAIILFITFGSLLAYGISHKETGLSIFIIGILFIVALLFYGSVTEYHEPKAIEVYQGKTTLEYTVKDGVKIDSVVVYKNKNHGSKRD